MALRGLAVAALAAAALAAPGAAAASVHVPAGHSVGEVTVVGQDVRVDGTVRASLTVVGGDVVLGPTARARDRVVVVGGDLQLLGAARVDGDIVQLGSGLGWPGGAAGAALLGALLLLRAALAALAVAGARLVASWSRVTAVADEVATFPGRTLLVGVLAGLGAGAGSLLLALTVIGLVAAAALWAALVCAGVLALAALLQRVGPSRGASAVVGLALFVPLLGELLASLAVVAGVGASVRLGSGTASVRRAARGAPG